MPRWLDEIEEELGKIGKNKKRPTRIVPKKSKSRELALPLFLLIVLLGVCVVATYLYKKDYFRSVSHQRQTINRYDAPRYDNRDNYFDRYYEEREKDTNDLWKRSRWNSDAITLLSIISNHNIAVAQNGSPKSQYIYINEDWTIDRLPEHLHLDAETRAFLERHMRKVQAD